MYNYTFSSKFILLQLTGSYFCSVTGYDMLASFTALFTTHELIVVSYCYISKQDYILYEFTKLSPNFTLLSVIGTITYITPINIYTM